LKYDWDSKGRIIGISKGRIIGISKGRIKPARTVEAGFIPPLMKYEEIYEI
jgi:hypothetical protein